jgi:hypothetical protein
MAVTNVCLARKIIGETSPGLTRYTAQFKVLCSSVQDGPQVILDSPLTPKLASHYAVANDFDVASVCVRVGVPRRAGNDKNLLMWLLDADYEWSRENRPEYQPVAIEPFFLQTTVPVRNALFAGFAKASSGGLVPFFPDYEKLVPGVTTGPVTNSAGIPVVPTPEIQGSKSGYRVRWRKLTWFDFGAYLNTVNNNAYTLTAHNTNEKNTTPGPIMFQKTFAPGTLRLNHVEAPIITLYDQRWYDVMMEFIEDDHYHYETDRGLARAAGPGDPDGRGGTFSNADFVDGKARLARLTDPDGNPLTEPVLFDGMGNPIDNPQPSDAVFLRWSVYVGANFNALPIGNIN